MSKLKDRLASLNKDFSTIFEANLIKAKNILEKATPIEYTYHGVQHAETLEKYVSELLTEEILNSLSADELFILLNGIYYHDVGMISYNKSENDSLVVNREEHNLVSYSMIYDEQLNKCNSIINVPQDNAMYAKSIALICKGHRDYSKYNESSKSSEKTRTIEEIPEVEHYHNGEVNTRFLACLVRIADELDITNQRAPHDVRIHLQNFINEFSLNQWMEHDLFCMVKIDSKVFSIKLMPYVDHIKQLDRDNCDRTIVRYPMFSKRKKISLELKELIPYLQDEKSKYRLGYKEIDISFDDTIVTSDDERNYQAQVDKAIAEAMLQSPSNPEDAKDFETPEIIKDFNTPKRDEDPENPISLERKRLLQKVNEEIVAYDNLGKLLSIGHFKLPSGVFSRFYINTNLFLPNSSALNSITDLFNDIYKDKDIDCIFGIDNAGRLLAPNLSLKLKCNYSYLVLENNESISVTFEKNCSITTANNVAIITDVVSTGNTIKEAITQIKNKFSVSRIFIGGVFCCNKTTLEELSREYETFCICNKFIFSTYKKEDIENDEMLENEFNLIKLINKSNV